MKALIHIGSNKAGSTSIQESLYASQEELLKAGILYPDLNYPAHRGLVLCFKEKPEKFSKAKKRKMDRKQAAKWGHSQLALLDSQLKESSAGLCILSSEYFGALKGTEIYKFKDFLDERFSEYQILAYVREAESLYCSSLQQAVKGCKTPYQAPWEFDARNRERIEKYVDCFGRNKIIVTKFDRNYLEKGDVVRDLLAKVGYRGEANICRANESIPAELVSLLVRFDRYLSEMQKGRHKHAITFIQKRRHLKKVAMSLESLKGHSRLSLPNQDWVDVLRFNQNSDAQWLNDTFYDGKSIFNTTERRFDAQELGEFSYQDFGDWLCSYSTEDVFIASIGALLQEVMDSKVNIRQQLRQVMQTLLNRAINSQRMPRW